MEKLSMGLALEELEAQRVELLPDRIEMHVRKRRVRSGNIRCDQQAIAVGTGVAVPITLATNGAQQCFRI